MSAVDSNRRLVASQLGLAPERMTFMRPDHGRGVAVLGVGGAEPSGVLPEGELRDVDALVTKDVGIGLVALAADCVPCLLVDPQARVIAAVHSGWRGVLVDVVGAALETMVELGARTADTRAIIGPSICGACYAVPADRVAEVGRVAPEAVATASDGQPSLDLRRAISARLRGMGVDVHSVGGCTAEDSDAFSHRRDGLTGRQCGAISLVVPHG